ncbi:hypothetical protein GR328_13565 [Microvirga makkahensis]|uniref:Uncharacterized protein n=1 Tax=Microvirga makkahensis TaxID=1128670 RepID=A0A7X3SPT9_9HYPH|nr:hypothetical protein [Microvirga makkahensis]
MDRDRAIDNVARAFYVVDNDEQTWEQAPEDVKETFRQLAKAAVAMISPGQDNSLGHQASPRTRLASREMRSE